MDKILCIILMVPFYIAICKCIDDDRKEFDALRKWINSIK